ncbi:tigger transposable element-derived protein 1-like [Palaemon carinicauda]|uniref:tigger transposable element-derived protein 1-like n=1 Tax=Palaemon carinicauda TaxID=392227 RepID=UPI0035B67B7B
MATQKPSRLKARDNYSEEDIKKALEDIEELGLSMRAAGRKYGIPESTLRHKRSGYHPISKKMGPKTVLTDAEEEVLVAYIKGSIRRANPVTKKNIIDAVSTILRTEREEGIERATPPSFTDKPKKKWWQLFRQRHPTVTYRTPETLTTSRKSISKQVILQWFADTQSFFVEEGMTEALHDPSRNFNIDESGFSLSPKQGRVLAIKGEKHVFEESSAQHKTNITVLANVCADGRIPPPMIIYPRKRISAHMGENFPEGYDCCVGKSEKGYITIETLYEYLCNSFNDWLNDNNVQRPIIIWTDWHETRNNYYLAKQLQLLNIVLYGLPPNTTHMMQPLDVSVFGPLKKSWSRGAKEFEHQNPDSMITQVNFAKVFLPIYYNCVSADNIKAGFKKCGLCPFDQDAPDYSKIESASSQREDPSTIFEGIDCGECSFIVQPKLYFNSNYDKAAKIKPKYSASPMEIVRLFRSVTQTETAPTKHDPVFNVSEAQAIIRRFTEEASDEIFDRFEKISSMMK